MRRISLSILGLFFGVLSAFSQAADKDTAKYIDRKLTASEINLVSSYYTQDGNRSPVTGGVGTEKLRDNANIIDLKLAYSDRKSREHIFTLEAGVDNYTSASSDKINPRTISSASSHDTRFYPSTSYTLHNDKKRFDFGVNASYSKEFDYRSFGTGIKFGKTSKDRNREFEIKTSGYFDRYTIIHPIELSAANVSSASYLGISGQGHSGPREAKYRNYPTQPRNSFDASFVLSQVVNKRFQVAVLADVAYQKGFLSTPFHRIYLNLPDTMRAVLEILPSTHLKIPLGVRASYFLGDRIIIKGYYRFYTDDWGLHSHTFNVETPIKLTPFISISPFYRFYTQSAVKYYIPYKSLNPSDTLTIPFRTTDDDLSKFNSNFLGIDLRFAPPKGIFGIEGWSMFEIRYGNYRRSDGLHSDIITANLKFKL